MSPLLPFHQSSLLIPFFFCFFLSSFFPFFSFSPLMSLFHSITRAQQSSRSQRGHVTSVPTSSNSANNTNTDVLTLEKLKRERIEIQRAEMEVVERCECQQRQFPLLSFSLSLSFFLSPLSFSLFFLQLYCFFFDLSFYVARVKAWKKLTDEAERKEKERYERCVGEKNAVFAFSFFFLIFSCHFV